MTISITDACMYQGTNAKNEQRYEYLTNVKIFTPIVDN